MGIAIGTALLVGGAIKGLTGLGKMWYGHRQRKKGLERQKEAEGMWSSRPEMEVPEGVNEMVRQYRKMAGLDRLPGQDIAEGNIRGTTAAGIEAAKDMTGGAGGLGAVTQMVAGQQEQFSNMNLDLAKMVQQNQGLLARGLGEKGQWQDKVWEYNKAQPWQTRYEQTYGEGQATEGAGVQNMWSGATQLGNVASDTMIGMAGGKPGNSIDPTQLGEIIAAIMGKQGESGVLN